MFVTIGWLALWVNQASSSYIDASGRASLIDLICVPTTYLSRKNVCVIGDCTHDCFVMCGMCCAPRILAILYLISPWYMISSFRGSFRAFQNCSSMHLK